MWNGARGFCGGFGVEGWLLWLPTHAAEKKPHEWGTGLLWGIWRFVQGSGFDELDFEGDLHVFADEDAAGFESGVPAQAEVLAIDFGGGGKADAGVAPRVLAGRAGAFDGECDGFGDAVKGQVAGDRVLAFAFLSIGWT